MSIRGIFPIDKWDFKSKSILQDLPAADFKLLIANQTEHTYLKGEVIFREGTFPSGIFFIKSGKVKKYKVNQDGKEHIIYVANSGELIGYSSVLADNRYSDSAAALEKSIVNFIPREDFLNAVQYSEALNRRLLKTLSHEFAVMANNISLFSQKSVRERLALQLVVLREKYKTGSGSLVEINMSRDDLASLVGTARENVVRVLGEFKEKGYVTTAGRKIIVIDVKSLVSIANYR
ncbi:MAG: Crp/Fnr family transcriptional regulator [Chitinophagaceae bacterium]|nr:Crp/Fnr family transcriptional regulator [Chitinophagaceae bacterium]MCW5929466.1 Crp/Fnr family transcriptional regulator [Chitinophagaceae bacterium]